LGLVKAVRRPGKAAEWDETILLKPKVVLQSTTDEITVDQGRP